MRRSLLVIPALCLAAALGGAAAAEVDIAAANACIVDAASAGGNPATCIDAAQDECLSNAGATPAVSALCFTRARDSWSAALGEVIAEVVARSDDRIAAIARIETKYDLLSNLLQCDRVEELAIAASELSGEEIGVQKARCQSTAAALTYVQLFLRARPNL